MFALLQGKDGAQKVAFDWRQMKKRMCGLGNVIMGVHTDKDSGRGACV